MRVVRRRASAHIIQRWPRFDRRCQRRTMPARRRSRSRPSEQNPSISCRELDADPVFRSLAPNRKGMQLGKKSKATDMFDKVRGDFGQE